MTNGDGSTLKSRRDEIQSRLASLERRLDDGYSRIDQALQDGVDAAAWEEFWIRLLREYEAVSQNFRPAA